MTETSAPVALLPPPVEISFSSTSSETPLPDCTANLMPFSIDYDGPAPIDSFLVLRPASASDSDVTDGSQSFISAFRGRAIQSIPLPLPAGYKAKLITVSQVAASAEPAAESSSRDTAAVQEEQAEAKEREAKRQRLAKPPQTQQRFSMDSDDDEDDDDERNRFSQEASSEPPQPSASLPNGAETPKSSRDEARISKEAGPKIRIAPIAEVSGDELRLWGADGPIDKGDDSFVRTIAEWYSVVSPLVSLPTVCSAQRRCRSALTLALLRFSLSNLCGTFVASCMMVALYCIPQRNGIAMIILRKDIRIQLHASVSVSVVLPSSSRPDLNSQHHTFLTLSLKLQNCSIVHHGWE